MKFWRRWIADLQAKSIDLTMLERGAYNDLLDYYYLTGGPIVADHAAIHRICRAADKSERDAIDRMLARFFARTAEGKYVQARCEREIAKQSQYADNQSRRGKLGADARWRDAEQVPRRKGNSDHAPAFVPPDWVIVSKWDAWVKIRPAKARTPAALAAAIEKLEKFRAAGHDPNAIIAESLANGWQGLFAPDTKRGAATGAPTGERPWIKCESCGKHVYTWTSRKCDTCWRADQGLAAG